MIRSIRTTFLLIGLFTLLFGIIYPLIVWGIGQLLVPSMAKGSFVRNVDNRTVGSLLIGQNFSQPNYFHPRPSLAGTGYDAMRSGSSNWSPTSDHLREALTDRAEIYRKENNLPPDAPIPADAVTTSSSGLDPHISIENAHLQVARIADHRGIAPPTLHQFIDMHESGRLFGLFGEKQVNVLLLNLELDAWDEHHGTAMRLPSGAAPSR